jgi:PAS domain S-box-containing protein
MTPNSSTPVKFINVRGTELLASDTRELYRQKLARITLDSMVQFVGLLDAKGTVLEINHVALDAVGITLSEVEGKPFWTTFWWQVSEEVNTTLREAILRAAQGEFVRWDAEIYGRAGGKETIIIDASLMPVKDEQGEVVFITAEGRDITEKKANEREIARQREELARLDELKTQFFANISHEFRTSLANIRRESAERETQLRLGAERERRRMEELLRQAPAAIGLMSGPEHRWTFVNDLYIRSTGRSSSQDFLGRTMLESLPELEGQGFQELLDQVYQTGKPYIGREMKAVFNRLPTGQNEEAYWDFVYQPVKDASGRVEGILAHSTEVTDRVIARRAIERAEKAQRLLAAIVESSDDAIVSKDLNGVVTSWNKGAERLFGYKAEEIIGRPITLVIPPELHKDETMILGKIRLGQNIDHFETVRLSKHGEKMDVSLTVSPVKDERGNVVGAAKIARNITENKKIEHALRTTEKLATAGRLAATVAHEINNPLAAVTNLVYLARRDMPDAAKVTNYLQMASRELDRVAHIARQTLGFYRDTSAPIRFSVTQTLDDLLLLYEKRMETRPIKLVKQYDGDPEITGLAGEIRQAFSNLITNSIDAMPTGGTLLVRVSKSRGWRNLNLPGIRITVCDTGCGIEAQHKKNLFQPFFTTKADVGTGLGLWITRSIVEKHRGTIRVKSRTGPKEHGTVFSIFLPSDPERAAAEKKVF